MGAVAAAAWNVVTGVVLSARLFSTRDPICWDGSGDRVEGGIRGG